MGFSTLSSSLWTTVAILSLVSAQNLDCKNILIDGQGFDISPLAGPHSVFHLYQTPTGVKNTTFTINLCGALDRSKVTDKKDECQSGTRVCAYERFLEDKPSEEVKLTDVWEVAGDFLHDNRPLEPILTRLKNSESHADAEKEGIRITLNGGDHDGVKQKAVVELTCDPDHTGLEDNIGVTTPSARRVWRRAEGENQNDGKGNLADPNAGKPLQLVSYKPEPSGGKNPEDMDVLRLSWKTKYACEGQKGKPDENKDTAGGTQTTHWGFFTWFIIILFLVVAGYLIFGSWINFSQHGARGWDLLPHGDTIQDIPYLLKDWARRVVNTVQGSGGNRGYYNV